MDEHGKKMIAPIVITVIVVLYYLLYFGVLLYFLPLILKILFGIIPLLLGGVMIYVCVERIREIKGGEEDDLSKY
ncbi:MAG: hypothetical protein K5877_06015 [Lachnospiraceae bacterium]|nr:hypothetical protein [Lachnospiraceae bacterium]